MESPNRTLAKILGDNAESRGDESAIYYQDSLWTFQEHYQRAVKLANALHNTGSVSGDRIAILAKNCIEYLELYSACSLAGYIIVPVNFRLSAEEAEYVCSNTEPVVCLYADEYEQHIKLIKKQNHSIKSYIRISDAEGDEFQDWVAAGKLEELASKVIPEDAACIIHTSGTTGRPKGAVLSHGALYGIAEGISKDAGLQSDDYGLVMQPLFHVGALFLQLAHHISGAKIRLENGFDPTKVWSILESDKVTTMQVVPTMLSMMLDEFLDGQHPKTSLKTIFYSTAPINEKLLRRGLKVFGQVFLQQYGSTEGGQVSSLAKHHHINDGSDEEQRWLKSAGRVNSGVEVRIVDIEGNTLPSGQAGEITVKHGNLLSAYWNDEEATDNSICDGFLGMGDVGYLDKDNFVYIVDRKKDMIISGGENIYPREVEAAILTHKAVLEVAVIGVPDERWGESVLAVVVLKENAKVSEAELVGHCKEHIASYKKPSQIKFIDELPRNSMGKVDKVSLRAPYWSASERNIA